MDLRFRALALVFCFVLLGCDKGLEPPPLPASISGAIHFAGVRPPCDSVRLLAVVLIEAAPSYVPKELIDGFLNNSILPFLLSSCSFRDTTYKFTVAAGKRYSYLGVAQNYDTNLYNDWRVVGFAHNDSDSALSFELGEGESRSGVDINVRFDSLPRQPFIP